MARDDAIAVRMFRQAVESGSPGGAADLARMYERGRGVTRDKAEAERWYRVAAARGDPRGLLLLSDLIADTDRAAARDFAREALARAEPLVAGGDPDALYVSGILMIDPHASGHVSRIDSHEGMKRLRRAAELHQTDAMSTLGSRLVSGHPEGLRNPREGVRWLEQAAARADPVACFTLGQLTFKGHAPSGIAQNPPRAMQLFECAAGQGHAEAAYRMGAHSSERAQERYWFRKAMQAGHPHARFRLAIMLVEGKGGPRDEAEALALLDRIVAEKRDAAEIAQIAAAIVRHRDSSEAALRQALNAVEAAIALRDPHLWIDTLALAHLRLGDAARAEALLGAELARRGDPDNLDAVKYRVALGQALAALGRKDEARTQWRRARDVWMDGIVAVEIEQRLQELDRP